MAFSDKSARQSLIPSFLYSSASGRTLALERMFPAAPSSSPLVSDVETVVPRKSFVIPAPSEPSKKIELYSPAYYAACTAGGILSCGLTHMTVTPLDLVKCNMQVRLLQICCFFSLFSSSISLASTVCFGSMIFFLVLDSSLIGSVRR